MSITASGNQWTRCARRTYSKPNGPLAPLGGKFGRDTGEPRPAVLARSAGPRDWPHWIQGSVALLLARAHGGPRCGTGSGTQYRSESLLRSRNWLTRREPDRRYSRSPGNAQRDRWGEAGDRVSSRRSAPRLAQL